MQPVLWTTTRPIVDAHLDLLEIHLGVVSKVSHILIWHWLVTETLTLNLPFSFEVKTGECQHDDECPTSEACIENYCVDPCDSDPCGRSAICKTSNHIPVCRCPENWAGNPHQECFECKCFIETFHSSLSETFVILFLYFSYISGLSKWWWLPIWQNLQV